MLSKACTSGRPDAACRCHRSVRRLLLAALLSGLAGTTAAAAAAASTSTTAAPTTTLAGPRSLFEGCEVPTHSSINLRQGRWPWTVQVLPERDNVFSMASNIQPARIVEGTLISRRHVLTTSADIGAQWEQLKIRFQSNDGQTIEVPVRRRYHLSVDSLYRDNFAVLELADFLGAPRYPDEIRPVCLLNSTVLANKSDDELITLLPTLSAFTTSITNNLCEVNVKFIPKNQCQQELEGLTNKQFDLSAYVCDQFDKCNDLVGSIAMIPDENQRFYFVGMLTFVFNHYAPHVSYPSLFQRITPDHLSWMKRVISYVKE